jgi:hypothetical protein
MQLPPDIQDFLQSSCGLTASPTLLTFCRRELMHACWEILLDDQFCEAYEHGTLLVFSDGIKRRVYPRIFTYSADYPEK